MCRFLNTFLSNKYCRCFTENLCETHSWTQRRKKSWATNNGDKFGRLLFWNKLPWRLSIWFSFSGTKKQWQIKLNKICYQCTSNMCEVLRESISFWKGFLFRNDTPPGSKLSIKSNHHRGNLAWYNALFRPLFINVKLFSVNLKLD